MSAPLSSIQSQRSPSPPPYIEGERRELVENEAQPADKLKLQVESLVARTKKLAEEALALNKDFNRIYNACKYYWELANPREFNCFPYTDWYAKHTYQWRYPGDGEYHESVTHNMLKKEDAQALQDEIKKHLQEKAPSLIREATILQREFSLLNKEHRLVLFDQGNFDILQKLHSDIKSNLKFYENINQIPQYRDHHASGIVRLLKEVECGVKGERPLPPWHEPKPTKSERGCVIS